MTARKYITDQWQPLSTPVNEPSNDEGFPQTAFPERDRQQAEFGFRHILFFASIVLFLFGPPLGWLTGSWGTTLVCVGLSGVLFGMSALLVPSQVYHLNDKL